MRRRLDRAVSTPQTRITRLRDDVVDDLPLCYTMQRREREMSTMDRQVYTRAVWAAVVLLGTTSPHAGAADGASQDRVVDTTPAPEVRAMWMHELAAVKRDMQRPCCRLEESRHIVVDAHSLIHPADKTPVDVVLRRTGALLENLRTLHGTPDLAWAGAALAELRERSNVADSEAQQTQLFLEVCAVRRRLALSNPLLSFEQIIFSRGTGYQGCIHIAPWGVGGGYENGLIRNSPKTSDWPALAHRAPEGESDPDEVARPGLFALSGYKTAAPSVAPLLTDAVIENGRHQGKRLVNFPGEYHFAFDLSYDGRTVLLAKRLGPDAPYHIFKAQVDGATIEQLTDSWFPDVEPCFMPDGRVAFISFRRWISARCLSFVPQACGTLFSMQADGSDVIPLSWHETSELFPTVDNDGRLVYTRWDYVDRDFSAGHHIWTSYPDGRDPRAPHGNYAYPHDTLDLTEKAYDGRGDRPWAEFHIRAIPNASGKYVAVAGIHHGSTPGVLVAIDTSIPDDNRMSQIRFIRGAEVSCETSRNYRSPDAEFLTPWPLSDSYYLASYQGNAVVLVDAFGNMELLTARGGQCPRPLRPRTKPPVIPAHTTQAAAQRDARSQSALISVVNVYDADQPWPPGTQITALRILRLVPKPWSSGIDHRRQVGYSQGGLPRIALGTVPVESDGSAHFQAPVGCEILFQALDERGMAIQSMRSGTYVHPGEHLSCVGCHEDKWRAPRVSAPKLAFRRPPSVIQPETSLGPVPTSYALLAKPVLERTCVPCHQTEKTGLDNAEYDALEPYAFYFHADGHDLGLTPRHGGYRTVAGRFGARESRMGKALLDETHRKLLQTGKITAEEFRRVVLWLDSNSLRLGAYHSAAAQERGELVWPLLEFDPENPLALQAARD